MFGSISVLLLLTWLLGAGVQQAEPAQPGNNTNLTADDMNLRDDNTKLTADDMNLRDDNTKLTADDKILTDNSATLTADDKNLTDDNAKLTADDNIWTVENAKLTSDDKILTGKNAKLTTDDQISTGKNAKLTVNASKLTPNDTKQTEDYNFTALSGSVATADRELEGGSFKSTSVDGNTGGHNCQCTVSRSLVADFVHSPGRMMPRQAANITFRNSFEDLFLKNVSKTGLKFEDVDGSDKFWTEGAAQLSMNENDFRVHMTRRYHYFKFLEQKISELQYFGFRTDSAVTKIPCLCNPSSVISWTVRLTRMKYDPQMKDPKSQIFHNTSLAIEKQVLRMLGLTDDQTVSGAPSFQLSSGSVIADVAILSSENSDVAMDTVTQAIKKSEMNSFGVEAVSQPTVEQCSVTPPEPMKNGQREWTGRNELGSVAQYTCDPHYKFQSGLVMHQSVCEKSTKKFTPLPDKAICLLEAEPRDFSNLMLLETPLNGSSGFSNISTKHNISETSNTLMNVLTSAKNMTEELNSPDVKIDESLFSGGKDLQSVDISKTTTTLAQKTNAVVSTSTIGNDVSPDITKSQESSNSSIIIGESGKIPLEISEENGMARVKLISTRSVNAESNPDNSTTTQSSKYVTQHEETKQYQPNTRLTESSNDTSSASTTESSNRINSTAKSTYITQHEGNNLTHIPSTTELSRNLSTTESLSTSRENSSTTESLSTSRGNSSTTESLSTSRGNSSTTESLSTSANISTTTQSSTSPSTTEARTTTTATITTSAGQTETAVSVRLKFTGMQWIPEYNDPNSEQTRNKSLQIAKLLLDEMSDPRVKRVLVNSLSRGSVVALSEVVVDDSNISPREYVQELITNSTQGGSLGNETIETNVTEITVLECSNSPPSAPSNGNRVWTGSVRLGAVASYFCNQGFQMRTIAGAAVQTPLNISCATNNGSHSFAAFPANTVCHAVATTTTPSTTTRGSTTATSRPPAATRPPATARKLSFFSTMIYSITIPVTGGILTFVFVCLCCLRIDSPMCRICEEAKKA